MAVIVEVKATTPGPCACCGVGSATMFCRTRGGTATLIGFSEYTTPSSPPKKYLTETVGGSFYSCDTDPTLPGQGPTCSGPLRTVSQRLYSGSASYDSVTGVLTNNQKDSFYKTANSISQPCTPAGDFQNDETFALPFQPRGGTSCPGGAPVSSLSTVHATYSYCATCFQQSFGTPPDWRFLSGDVTADLSNEDTEDNAIARLLAGAGGTWGAYTQVGDGTGGTCTPDSCCKAQYEQRTTGFSFAYGESQFKLVMSGLLPLTNYVVTVLVYRRLIGSATWELLFDSPYGFTTDALGGYTIADQDVPNLEGYETYACCPFVYIP